MADADGTVAAAETQAVAATHIRAHETSETFACQNADLAQRLYEAYLQGKVGERVDVQAADYDDTVVFEMADGGEVRVSFNAHHLRDGDACRAFDDRGGFWELLAEMDGGTTGRK